MQIFRFKVEDSNFQTILSGTGISAMSNKIQKIYLVFGRVDADACSEEQTPSTRSSDNDGPDPCTYLFLL